MYKLTMRELQLNRM